MYCVPNQERSQGFARVALNYVWTEDEYRMNQELYAPIVTFNHVYERTRTGRIHTHITCTKCKQPLFFIRAVVRMRATCVNIMYFRCDFPFIYFSFKQCRDNCKHEVLRQNIFFFFFSFHYSISGFTIKTNLIDSFRIKIASGIFIKLRWLIFNLIFLIIAWKCWFFDLEWQIDSDQLS